MLVAAELAVARGALAERDRQALADLIASLGPLPPIADLSPPQMLEAMRHDKKMVAGRLHFVLPTAIGATTIVDDVTEKEMKAALTARRLQEVSARQSRPYSLQLRDQRLVADLQQFGRAAAVAAPPPSAPARSSAARLRPTTRRDASASVPDRSIWSHGLVGAGGGAATSRNDRFRWRAWIVSPSVRMTARSMQFCSSRTLPGHA